MTKIAIYKNFGKQLYMHLNESIMIFMRAAVVVSLLRLNLLIKYAKIKNKVLRLFSSQLDLFH